MKKFEYKIVEFPPNRKKAHIVSTLNTYGEDGWEVISVSIEDDFPTYVFKRVIPKVNAFQSPQLVEVEDNRIEGDSGYVPPAHMLTSEEREEYGQYADEVPSKNQLVYTLSSVEALIKKKLTEAETRRLIRDKP